ncbi:subtilisin-like serine protease [Phlyctochytrium planicorne]|nr:subtilisin-like serine protease [Phlyctochytrium planicorne]
MHLLPVLKLITGFIALAQAAPFTLQAGSKIANQFIIQYRADANESVIAEHESWLQTASLLGQAPLQRRANGEAFPAIPRFSGFTYMRKYTGRVRGYAAKISAPIAEVLKSLPEVELVEQDAIASITAVQNSPPAWGLRRISKASLPLPSAYTYPDSAGAGVNVYVIDTGVEISHPEFQQRASIGAIAGTIASASYGVAKKASIVAVKVLSASGSGTNSDVIAGINWVATNGPRSGKACVANMSLGGGASTAVDNAVTAAVRAGCSVVVAAGNNGGQACSNSPARSPTAFTVAASDINDAIASFSDRGSCVDIVAPGVNIASTWIRGGSRSISGTSMASPHVAGVFAVAISQGVSSNPTTLMNYVSSIATSGKITGLTTATKNLLLQVPQ